MTSSLLIGATVNSIVWQGGYFQTQLATGDHDYNWSWRVVFWNDSGDGSHPGSEIYNMTIEYKHHAVIVVYLYQPRHPGITTGSPTTPLHSRLPMHFNANTKYWITLTGLGEYPPQACWSRHNNTVGGIKLHQAVFKGAAWGYTDWINLSTMVPDGLPHDLNFQLLGDLRCTRWDHHQRWPWCHRNAEQPWHKG